MREPILSADGAGKTGNSILSSTVREISLRIALGRESTSCSEREPSRPKSDAISKAPNSASISVRSRFALECAAFRASLALNTKLKADTSCPGKNPLRRSSLALSMKLEARGAFASNDAPASSTKTNLLILKFHLWTRLRLIRHPLALLRYYQQGLRLWRVRVDRKRPHSSWSRDKEQPPLLVLG